MKLPNLEQYINAFQIVPNKIFTDPILKNCIVQKNALGLPRARSGNFTTIFKLCSSSDEYAVRCFLKMSETTQIRYANIEKRVTSLQKYFIKVIFQKKGVFVSSELVPIIKMQWISGLTLGEFINKEYSNKQLMFSLQESLRELFTFLYSIDCAHGDIQPGNIIVDENGKKLTLVDYDGMYLPEIDKFGALEVGHINFQHPKRSIDFFSKDLDFFSFILLDVALTCLINDPDLWDLSFSDEEGILFRAEDLRNPVNSFIFDTVHKIKNCRNMIENFASICLNPFRAIPNPCHFYNEKFITKENILFHPIQKKSCLKTSNHSNNIGPYINSNMVLNANLIDEIKESVGNRVELIGKIHEVRVGKSQFGNSIKLRPYIYLDFNPMESGKFVRVKFLPEIIEKTYNSKKLLPNQRWTGKWVTITETILPIREINHPSFQSGLLEISVEVENINQIRIIAESEACYRLGKKMPGNSQNSDLVDGVQRSDNSFSRKNQNQNIINKIKNL